MSSPNAPGLSNPARRRQSRRPDYRSDDPLLTAAESAAEMRKGLSTFWRDLRAGLIPPPYYVSPRCPRWRLSEIRAVVEGGRERRPPAAS